MMSKNVQKILTKVLIVCSFVGLLLGGGALQAAATSVEHLTYYGADLQAVVRATGVHLDGTVDPNGPWPQFTDNYCFVSVVQAIVNYADIMQGKPLRYPHQSDQGPASKDPADEQAGQILYDMDHLMIPPGGPLVAVGTGASRRPYTLANIAYDFGGDPRSQAFGTNYEAPWNIKYHEHIYHTSAADATLGMARALVKYRKPVIALVNHAEHSALVAGFWATGNPLTDPHAKIRALAVFNSWDMNWGTYLSTANYARISYNDWINATNLPAPWGGVNSWFSMPYSANGTLDPDPSIGIYQAGPGTANPDATHWIGNFVVIQPDEHNESANYAFDENDHIMLHP